MTYDQCFMSSEWHIIPSYVIRMTQLTLASHLDELLQRYYVIQMTCASTLKLSGWDSKFFHNTRWPFRWNFDRRNIHNVHVLQSRAFLTLNFVNYLFRNPNALINMLSRTWFNEATIQDWSVLAFPTTCAISVLGYDRKWWWYECIS